MAFLKIKWFGGYLADIKFGVSPRPVYAPVRSTYMLAATNISENMQFAKFAKYNNSMPKFVDLQ